MNCRFLSLPCQFKGLRAILIILLSYLIAGCSQLNYYSQAILGQQEIFAKAQPIQTLLQSPKTSPSLKQKLTNVVAIRKFATETLHLPDNDSYSTYADLERPYVLWNVVANPPFSLKSKTWCFPFVGCLSYRGYFKQADAQAFAEKLKKQGFDVYIGDIPAYSTLGWFDDPVLNTMMHWSRPHLASLIFHELAHQLVYVRDDTDFNEGFASTVEVLGVTKWLAAYGSQAEKQAYQQYIQRQQTFIKLVLETKQQLAELYAQDLPTTAMQKQKTTILNQLQENYEKVKNNQWDGYSGYDAWFAKLNNAKLALVSTYQKWVPAFKALFQQSQDFKQFYQAVIQLTTLSPAERNLQLKSLL